MEDREAVAAGLLGGFEGDLAPALDAFAGSAIKAFFAALGDEKVERVNAKLCALLDNPFQVIELKESGIESQEREHGLGGDRLVQLEYDAGFVRFDDSGKPGRLVIADFVLLAALDAQDASEVVCVVAREFGAAMMKLGNEEAAACHVQSSVS